MAQNSDPAVLAFFLSLCLSGVAYAVIMTFINSRKRPPGDDAPGQRDQISIG
jgi:hypothetical protein